MSGGSKYAETSCGSQQPRWKAAFRYFQRLGIRAVVLNSCRPDLHWAQRGTGTGLGGSRDDRAARKPEEPWPNPHEHTKRILAARAHPESNVEVNTRFLNVKRSRPLAANCSHEARH